MPHFSVDIDYSSIRCGPVQSRSRENVFGMVWGCKRNKKSRIFIAFDSKIQLQNFSKYFRKLLKFFNNDCENGKWILMTIHRQTKLKARNVTLTKLSISIFPSIFFFFFLGPGFFLARFHQNAKFQTKTLTHRCVMMQSKWLREQAKRRHHQYKLCAYQMHQAATKMLCCDPNRPTIIVVWSDH